MARRIVSLYDVSMTYSEAVISTFTTGTRA